MAPETTKFPVVRNIAELEKRVPRGDLLIHFTKDQWARLVRNAKKTKGVPKHGLRLEFTPDPNGDGTARVACNPGPAEECSFRIRRDPEGGITVQCRCSRVDDPTPGGGGGSGGPLTPPDCAMSLRSNGSLRCLRVACRGRCEQRIARVGSRFLLFCVCA